MVLADTNNHMRYYKQQIASKINLSETPQTRINSNIISTFIFLTKFIIIFGLNWLQHIPSECNKGHRHQKGPYKAAGIEEPRRHVVVNFTHSQNS